MTGRAVPGVVLRAAWGQARTTLKRKYTTGAGVGSIVLSVILLVVLWFVRDADFAEHRRRTARSMRRPGRRSAFTATTRTSHAPVEAVLDRVQAPTLVVMGTRDPDFPDPAAEATLVADRLRGRSVLIEDAGHYPHAEFPERTTPILLEFARACSGGTGA